MKKNSRKLSLNRETLRSLQELALKGVGGGATTSFCNNTTDCTDSCAQTCFCETRAAVCL